MTRIARTLLMLLSLVAARPSWGADPSDISSVDAWYDATDSSTLTADPNNRVSKWDNKISGNAHLEQASVTKRPITGNTAGPNSLATVTFAGNATLQQMEVSTSSISRTQPFEVWVAVQVDGDLAVNNMTIWDADDPNGGQRSYLNLHPTTGGIRIYAGSIKAGTAWPDEGSMHVARVLMKTGSACQCWIDEVSFVGPVNAGSNGLNELTLGANGSTSNPLTGRIGEIFVSDTELSAADVTAMWLYMSKWTVDKMPIHVQQTER